nr:MAG TPA: hypothetical protein [Caudoviricetes sp.]
MSSSETCSLDLIHKYALMNQKESLHFLSLKTKQMEISFQCIKHSSAQNLRFVALSCDMLAPGALTCREKVSFSILKLRM